MSHCNRSVVETLVNAGADVQTSFKTGSIDEGFKMTSAIEFAITRKNAEVVRVLLAAGAHLPDISIWPTHNETYEVLRQAKMAKDGVHVPEFKKARKQRKAR